MNRRNAVIAISSIVFTGASIIMGIGGAGAEEPKLAKATLAGGCFWCTEAVYAELKGVKSVTSGYIGGPVPNPTYKDVCTGQTGHAEAIEIEYDPEVVSFAKLLEVFFATHDPTTLNRQGADMGTQYRSAIYATSDAQLAAALASKAVFAERLAAAGYGSITTEIAPAGVFYYAEPYHQQYLGKNPNGYCGIGGTGVSCPIGLTA